MPNAHKTMPWITLPVFLLLGTQLSLADNLALDAWAPLCIPLAALLGRHFQQRGLVVVALSGLFLIPGVELSDWAHMPALIDIYLLSLGACLLTLRTGTNIPHQFTPLSNARLALFLLLPIGIGLWGIELEDVHLTLSISLAWIVLAFMFYLGLTGAGFGIAVLLVTLVFAIGFSVSQFGLALSAQTLFAADRIDLPLIGLVELQSLWISYLFRTFADVVAALTFFAAGRVCGPFLRDALAPQRWVAILLLATIGLLSTNLVPLVTELSSQAWSETFPKDPEPPATQRPDVVSDRVIEEVIVMGAKRRAYPTIPLRMSLVPLLGLVTALLFSYRGIFLALSAVPLLWVLEAIIRGYFPGMMLDLGAVFVLFGFSALGLAMRASVLGITLRWWSTAWAVYIGFTVVAFAALEPPGAAWLPPFLIAAVLVGLGTIRFRNWLQGRPSKPHSGWIALLSLAAILWTVWSSFSQMIDAVVQLGAAATIGSIIDDLEDWLLLAAGGFLALWLILTALEVLVNTWPQCLQDLRRLRKVTTCLISKRNTPPPDIEPAGEPPNVLLWWHPSRPLIYLKKGTVAIAVIIMISASSRVGWSAFQEYREDLAEDRISDALWTPNQSLVQATLDTLEPWGIARQYRDGNRIRVQTDWHESAELPSIRRRASVRIGSGDSIFVSVDRQARRYGFWVEVSGDWRLEREDADTLEQLVLDHAGGPSLP